MLSSHGASSLGTNLGGWPLKVATLKLPSTPQLSFEAVVRGSVARLQTCSALLCAFQEQRHVATQQSIIGGSTLK